MFLPASYGVGLAESDTSPVDISPAAAPTGPSWQVYGRSAGSVEKPCELFYMDTSVTNARFELLITNAGLLAKSYRYLLLVAVIQKKDEAGQWQRVHDDLLLSLGNASTAFTLENPGSYRIRVESGSYYCITTSGELSPRFYLLAH